jgi:uncharacterized damage-inducible protein DinB
MRNEHLHNNSLETFMPISAALLPELDKEMANTRKLLERVPEDKLGWQPHQKSMTMERLARHVAQLPGWAVEIIGRDSLDIAQPEAFQSETLKSRDELLATFDKSVAAGRAAIAGAGDEHLMKPWSLVMGEKTIFTMPRIAVLRGMMMNHLIHHRAQLGVYLRLNDVPVPGMYGPSADEGSF